MLAQGRCGGACLILERGCLLFMRLIRSVGRISLVGSIWTQTPSTGSGGGRCLRAIGSANEPDHFLRDGFRPHHERQMAATAQ